MKEYSSRLTKQQKLIFFIILILSAVIFLFYFNKNEKTVNKPLFKIVSVGPPENIKKFKCPIRRDNSINYFSCVSFLN